MNERRDILEMEEESHAEEWAAGVLLEYIAKKT